MWSFQSVEVIKEFIANTAYSVGVLAVIGLVIAFVVNVAFEEDKQNARN